MYILSNTFQHLYISSYTYTCIEVYIYFKKKKKNHNRQPKGFNIKFNLSLCANNKHLQRSCKSILNKASRNILKEVIKAVNIDIYHLKRKRKQLKTKLYNTILHNEFKATCAWIRKKVNGIQKTVRQRHSRKLSRDKIDLHSKNIQEKRPKNRRFSKDAISAKKINKRKRNKTNSKQRIALAKESGIVPKVITSKGTIFYPYTCRYKLV